MYGGGTETCEAGILPAFVRGGAFDVEGSRVSALGRPDGFVLDVCAGRAEDGRNECRRLDRDGEGREDDKRQDRIEGSSWCNCRRFHRQ